MRLNRSTFEYASIIVVFMGLALPAVSEANGGNADGCAVLFSGDVNQVSNGSAKASRFHGEPVDEIFKASLAYLGRQKTPVAGQPPRSMKSFTQRDREKAVQLLEKLLEEHQSRLSFSADGKSLLAHEHDRPFLIEAKSAGGEAFQLAYSYNLVTGYYLNLPVDEHAKTLMAQPDWTADLSRSSTGRRLIEQDLDLIRDRYESFLSQLEILRTGFPVKDKRRIVFIREEASGRIPTLVDTDYPGMAMQLHSLAQSSFVSGSISNFEKVLEAHGYSFVIAGDAGNPLPVGVPVVNGAETPNE